MNVLKNKFILYIILISALFNILTYLANDDFDSITFFCATAILINEFNKNMSITLLSAILFTIYFNGLSLIEGNQNNADCRYKNQNETSGFSIQGASPGKCYGNILSEKWCAKQVDKEELREFLYSWAVAVDENGEPLTSENIIETPNYVGSTDVTKATARYKPIVSYLNFNDDQKAQAAAKNGCFKSENIDPSFCGLDKYIVLGKLDKTNNLGNINAMSDSSCPTIYNKNDNNGLIIQTSNGTPIQPTTIYSTKTKSFCDAFNQIKKFIINDNHYFKTPPSTDSTCQ